MLVTYLCGPINGCNDSEAKDWREYVKSQLPAIVDPMVRDYRGREMEPGIDRAIVLQDKADVDGVDILLVNYVKPSVGTAMEILYAWERRKAIYLVADPAGPPLSPWLTYHATRIFGSLTEAVAAIRALPGNS